jgi:hypothetical protein
MVAHDMGDPQGVLIFDESGFMDRRFKRHFSAPGALAPSISSLVCGTRTPQLSGGGAGLEKCV